MFTWKASTKTRFEKEAKGNSEMAYSEWVAFLHHDKISIPKIITHAYQRLRASHKPLYLF